MSNSIIDNKINQIRDMENSNNIDIQFLKNQVDSVKSSLNDCTMMCHENSLDSKTLGIINRQVLPILGLLMDTIGAMNTRIASLEYNNIFNEQIKRKVDDIMNELKEK
jgi:hypothetical protein|uniref:Uncharacterized protein n=1 Tax=viral metagenome TaxID=1070528 RepID=A0A6C0JDW6_9ZZZZ